MKRMQLLTIVFCFSLILAGCAGPSPPPETPSPTPMTESTPPEVTAPQPTHEPAPTTPSTPIPSPNPEEPPTTPTEVSGMIRKDTTWSGGILITGKLTVATGVTLTIEPGTVVRFKHWRPGYTEPVRRIQLNVDGILRAVGTPEEPIRFTSDAPEPEHSDWMMVNFSSSSGGSIIDYSIVEFGRGGIGVNHADIIISNNILRWGQGANIWLEGSSATITRNRIYGAGHGGIEMSNSNRTITHNVIYDNGLGIVPINKSNPVIRYNSIHDNRFIGILVMGLSSPLIEYNNIVGNANEGVKIGTANATVRYNNIYGSPILPRANLTGSP